MKKVNSVGLALLAILAASGHRGLSRDKLIAALWPDTDAEHGRGLLRQACYALRRDLHAPELFLGSIQLRLNPAVISSDVQSFAGALEEHDPARAVACYSAPFLDGFYLNGGGEFEDWAETERARLAGVIGRVKKVSGLSIHAPEREEAVLRSVMKLAEGRFGSLGIERVFRAVIEETRRAQEGSE